MAFIRRKIDWTAPVTPAESGLTMEPEQNPYIADVSANTEPDSREWNISFTQGEETGNVVNVKVTQPPVYKFTICYYDKNVTEEEPTAEHTSGATIILCADMEGRIRIGQGTVSENGCCEIVADQESGYVFACGAREWSEYGDDILVSAGTGDSQSITGGSDVNFLVDDFDDCETVRSASPSATYEGSISIWATSKSYRNNICGSGATAGDQFSFYMLVGEGQEECQVVNIAPEVEATTDISNFVWNYSITGVDETVETLPDYTVTVSPISDNSVTGHFTLESPRKQDISLLSNVPIGTPVKFYRGTSGTDLIEETNTVQGDPTADLQSTASTSVVGCSEKIDGENFLVKADYELKVIEASSSTTFSVSPTEVHFTSGGEDKDNTGATAATITVESTSSLTNSMTEQWGIGRDGSAIADRSNNYTARLMIVQKITSGGTSQCGYGISVVTSSGETPTPNVIGVIFVNNSGNTITELTVPNTVKSNSDAMAYFSAATTINGEKKYEPQNLYTFTFDKDITDPNTYVQPAIYYVSASISGVSTTMPLKLYVEGTGMYNIVSTNVLSVDTNKRFSEDMSDIKWKLALVKDDGDTWTDDIIEEGLSWSQTETNYVLKSAFFDKVSLRNGDKFALKLIDDKSSSESAPTIKFNDGSDAYLADIEAHMNTVGGTDELISGLGNGEFEMVKNPLSENLALKVTLKFYERI